MGLQDLLKTIQDSVDKRKEVEIRGHKIELGLLSLEDEQKVNATDTELEALEGVAYVNALRKKLLSYSIRSVDGEKIPPYIETEEEVVLEEGVTDKKVIKVEKAIFLKSFLSKFPVHIIDQLFDVYIDIRDESEQSIKEDVKYDWFKDPEVRKKEQEEELKKLEEKQRKDEEEKAGDTKKEGEEEINLREIPKEASDTEE